jgi:hypothetical protein
MSPKMSHKKSLFSIRQLFATFMNDICHSYESPGIIRIGGFTKSHSNSVSNSKHADDIDQEETESIPNKVINNKILLSLSV